MDYLHDRVPHQVITAELGLTEEQLEVALNYLDAHRADVDAAYQRIVDRTNQGNPAWVVSENAASVDDLRRRIEARHREQTAHVGPGRQ
jgi:hypothetical protein